MRPGTARIACAALAAAVAVSSAGDPSEDVPASIRGRFADAPPGKLLHTGGGDRRIRVWEASSGNPLDAIETDSRPAALVACGDRLYVGFEDGTICMYEHRP